MKTKPSARYLVGIRVTMISLAIAVLVGIEIQVSASLAAHIGQTTARQTGSPQAPNMSISDLMAAAR